MNNQTLFRNKDLGVNLDFTQVSQQLTTLFRSPNPFYIYSNIQDINEMFSSLLSELTLKIRDGFEIEGTDTQSFMMMLYKQANYQEVWMHVIRQYVSDSKNFSLLDYIYYVKILVPEKHHLALALFKIHLGESELKVHGFLKNNNSNLDYKDIKKIYDDFGIAQMKFDINLREDFVEHFIEKIYLQLELKKAEIFLDHFVIKFTKLNCTFTQISQVISKIIASYSSDDKYIHILDTVEFACFEKVKHHIDYLILNYEGLRSTFNFQITETLLSLGQNDRAVFWKYVKREMIDIYYPEVKNIFYESSSNVFMDKNTYSLLAGNIKLQTPQSPEAQYIQEQYEQIITLKNIILEGVNNVFSFFILPVIYYTISERISLRKKDLYKIKYLLLFLFSNDYREYKKIYMFFNQLEIFLNYENAYRPLSKLQVAFSLVLVSILFFVFTYHFLPIGIFVALIILFIAKYIEVIHPNVFFKLRWNIGIKFFATVMLIVSGYFWFQNWDSVEYQTMEITQKMETLGTLSSKDAIENSFEYVRASLFDIK